MVVKRATKCGSRAKKKTCSKVNWIELAGMCLAAMQRKDKDDPIEYESKSTAKTTTFESKYLSQDKNREEQK